MSRGFERDDKTYDYEGDGTVELPDGSLLPCHYKLRETTRVLDFGDGNPLPAVSRFTGSITVDPMDKLPHDTPVKLHWSEPNPLTIRLAANVQLPRHYNLIG